MSRSGYSDDLDERELALWRGAVLSAIRGKRGQRLLRDAAAALDAMPAKRLIAGELEAGGEVCLLGAVGKHRGVDLSALNPYDRRGIAKALDIAPALAAECAFENDEAVLYGPGDPEQIRWRKVRQWVEENLQEGKVDK